MLKISELKTKTKTDRLGKNRQVSLTIKRAWLEIELDTCTYIYIYIYIYIRGQATFKYIQNSSRYTHQHCSCLRFRWTTTEIHYSLSLLQFSQARLLISSHLSLGYCFSTCFEPIAM